MRQHRIGRRVYEVPQNVSRLEAAGWSGWTVRFRSKPTANKSFSDAEFETASEALAAAAEYADEQRPTKRTRCSPERDIGIKLVHRKRQGRVDEVFVEVAAVAKGQSPKRLYVGTTNTVTPDRIREKWKTARGYRQQLVSARAKVVRGKK